MKTETPSKFTDQGKRLRKLATNKAWRDSRPYSSWTEEQKEKSRAKTRAHYRRNHEEQKARWRAVKKARYAKEKHKVLDANKKWAKENPETKLEIAQRRRARRLNATISPEKISAWMTRVKSKEFARCYYCRERFRTTKIHFDHIVPLAKGGQHSLGNICVSCASCNLRKGTNLVSSWTRNGQQVLDV